MRIRPEHLVEFRTWVLQRYPTESTLRVNPELEEFIRGMKTEQWRIIADEADRQESDVLGNFQPDLEQLLELEPDEEHIYREFLRSHGYPEEH